MDPQTTGGSRQSHGLTGHNITKTSSRTTAIHMLKVRAHSRIEGNERANRCASLSAYNDEHKLEIDSEPAHQVDIFRFQTNDSYDNFRRNTRPTSDLRVDVLKRTQKLNE